MGFVVRERLVLFYLREATGTKTRFFFFVFFLHAFTSLDHSINEGAAPTVNKRPNSILAISSLRTGAYCYILSHIYSPEELSLWQLLWVASC